MSGADGGVGNILTSAMKIISIKHTTIDACTHADIRCKTPPASVVSMVDYAVNLNQRVNEKLCCGSSNVSVWLHQEIFIVKVQSDEEKIASWTILTCKNDNYT